MDLFAAATQSLGEEIENNTTELVTVRSNLADAETRLGAQNTQVSTYEALAEPQRQRYMDAQITALLTHITQDPAAMAIVEAYMDAQSEFYTAAQENVAQVG